MSDDINVKITLDPSQVQAGSSDAAAAVQAASNSIVSALGKVETASKDLGTYMRAGFYGVGKELQTLQSKIDGVAAAVRNSSSAVSASLNTIPSAARNAGHSMAGIAGNTAAVRREFLVLGHEIITGNWTRFGGSLSVLAQRMDLFRGITLATVGSVAAIAAVIGTVAVAAFKGTEEINKLNRELTLTGNAAGLTEDKFLSMAHAISDANKMITVGNARDAVSAVAATGAFGPKAVQAVASAVSEISRLSGETADRVAQDFAKMSDGVYKWANDSKDAKNLVTGADAEYVRQLEEQGRTEEAEIYLAQRISERLRQVSSDLGVLPSLWNEVKDAASAAWDVMMNIGRPTSLETQIRVLEDKKKSLQSIGPAGMLMLSGGDTTIFEDTVGSLDKQISALKQKKQAQDGIAAADAKQAEVNREGKAASERLVKDNEQLKTKSALTEKIAEYERDIAKSKLAGGYVPSEKEQKEYIAHLNETYTAHMPKVKSLGAGGALAVPRAEDNGELALLKDKLSYEESLLETSYKSGEVSLQQYYADRMKIVKEGMSAEIEAVQRGMAAAERAAKFANKSGPNQQQEAQARILQAKNKVALLNQQLQEQESKLTATMKEQVDAQNDKIEKIVEQQKTSRLDFEASQAQRIGQIEVELGQKTAQQLIVQEMQTENQKYQAALEGLNKRLALQKQAPEEQAQLNAQIEKLEQQHQTKMTELQAQSLKDTTKLQKQAMTDFTSDLESLTAKLVEKPKQWKQAFMGFFTSIDQQLVKLSTNFLFQQFMGPGTSAGSTLNGLFGKLLGGVSGSSASQQIASASILTAQVPSMTVGTMTVASSIGGVGGVGSAVEGLSGGGLFGGVGMAGYDEAPGSLFGMGTFDGGSEGLASTLGLASYAVGTPYVPQTQLALIHRGEAIIPANQNSSMAQGGGAMSVTNNFTLPGQTDVRTQAQIAALAGQGIQRAIRRNT